MRKRYKLCMEFEIEVDDVRDIPISREGWPDDAPGEYIVERMAAIKQFYQKILDNPEVIDEYMRYYILLLVNEGLPGMIDQLSQQLGIEKNCDEIVDPVIDQLEGIAARHMHAARELDQLTFALDLFWGAFHEKIVSSQLEEVEI
jgi:hypothetical protein